MSHSIVAFGNTYTGVNGFKAKNSDNRVINFIPVDTADNGKVIVDGDLVPQTARSSNIVSNGTYDTTTNNSVTVDVPNSYTAADEGKVVSSGALVAQTSRTVTVNGTYDTTENNEVLVDVSGGTVNLQSKTATQNGTVTPDLGYDGLSSVFVNVQGSGGIAAAISAENGTLVTDGVTVKTQPVITDDQIGATASDGLSISISASTKLQMEFDLTIKSGNSSIVLSFGGSNVAGGVYIIDTQRFQLYANGVKFNIPISLSENVKYKIKILLTSDTATLYVDGVQTAVGQSDYVRNAISYIFSGNDVALLFNQSSHSEYSNSLVDNVTIQVSL